MRQLEFRVKLYHSGLDFTIGCTKDFEKCDHVSTSGSVAKVLKTTTSRKRRTRLNREKRFLMKNVKNDVLYSSKLNDRIFEALRAFL